MCVDSCRSCSHSGVAGIAKCGGDERVRFLVDQGSAAAAVAVARRCTADRAWCAQLLGFALHSAGDYRGADSAFDAASAAQAWSLTLTFLNTYCHR